MTQSLEAPQQRIMAELRKRKVAKLFQVAEKYGVVKRGFTAIDYLFDAIKNFGWESTAITGPKGSAKSNLLLQRGRAIYQDKAALKRHTVTKRTHFLDLMEGAIEQRERIPWMGIDDIATIFPSSLYHTHRKIYSELKSDWETVRTAMNCFDFTCTRKNKVASFILEDITGDIICYNRISDLLSHYDYRRWLWLRSLKDPTRMVAKLISIEDIPFPLTPDAFLISKVLTEGKFIVGGTEYIGEAFYKERAQLTGLSRTDFNEYWEERLDLAQTSWKRFRKIVEQPTPKPVSDSERSEAGRALRQIGLNKTKGQEQSGT
jgi:hypothetical protein